MKHLIVGRVEGESKRKGLKQNKTYTIVSESQANKNFYNAVDEKGNEFSIWNVDGDWSKIGIRRVGSCRISYTTDFTLT